MLSWMANTYVKFVNNNLLIVLRHTLYKNSTILRGLAKVFVYETFTDEVIEYLLSKSFLCYFAILSSDNQALFDSA